MIKAIDNDGNKLNIPVNLEFGHGIFDCEGNEYPAAYDDRGAIWGSQVDVDGTVLNFEWERIEGLKVSCNPHQVFYSCVLRVTRVGGSSSAHCFGVWAQDPRDPLASICEEVESLVEKLSMYAEVAEYGFEYMSPLSEVLENV